MPSITYAVEVCTEARELNDLLTFLTENKMPAMTSTCSSTPAKLLKRSETSSRASIYPRASVNTTVISRRTATITRRSVRVITSSCSMPMRSHRDSHPHIKQFDGDILFIPRINIVPGYTRAFLEKHKFNVNDAGFINWPDYQGRYYKNDPKITWSGKVHEKLTGSEANALEANPSTAIWHVKSVAKQNAQNELYESL